MTLSLSTGLEGVVRAPGETALRSRISFPRAFLKSSSHETFDSSTAGVGSGEKSRFCCHTSLQGLPCCGGDLLRGGSGRGGVYDGSLSRGDPDSVAHHHVSRKQGPGGGVDCDSGRPPPPIAPRARDRQMHGLGDHVGEIEKVQSALMRDDRHVSVCDEPGSDHILPGRRRVLSKAVETVAHPAEAAPGPGVVCQERLAEAALPRLGRCEVPALLGGHVEEPPVIGLS